MTWIHHAKDTTARLKGCAAGPRPPREESAEETRVGPPAKAPPAHARQRKPHESPCRGAQVWAAPKPFWVLSARDLIRVQGGHSSSNLHSGSSPTGTAWRRGNAVLVDATGMAAIELVPERGRGHVYKLEPGVARSSTSVVSH